MNWVVCHRRLLDQVNKRENRDPDNVNEVPVKRRDIDVDRIFRSETSAIIDRKEREKPDHSSGNVCAVKSREREERRSKEIGMDREAFMNERCELECLSLIHI